MPTNIYLTIVYIYIFFSGAKLCIVKKKRAAELTEMNINMNVVVPFQPKTFREQKPSSKETQFNKLRKNHKLSHAPEPPINPQVAGQLGRLNAPNGTLHKFIAKEIAMSTADDDPTLIRQKILRHAYKVTTTSFEFNFWDFSSYLVLETCFSFLIHC